MLRLLEHARAGIDRKRLLLAQSQKTREMVDVTIGEKNSGNRSLARRAPRVETAVGVNLLPQVRRGVQKQPTIAVGADS